MRGFISIFASLLLNATLFAVGLSAQTNPFSKGHSAKVFGLDDGLTQVSIHSIIVDKQGYLWIGTQDGLNRFDGYTFKKYYHNPGDPESLCGNFINQIYEGPDGKVWVQTVNDGLCYFDPKTEKFSSLNSFRDDFARSVQGITSTKDGSLVVGENNFIHFITPEKDSFIFDSHQLPDAKDEIVVSLASDGQNNIWIGTNKGQVYLFKDQVFHPKIANQKITNINNFLFSEKAVFLASDQGLYLYNRDTESLNFIDLYRYSSQISNQKYTVYTMMSWEDNLWLACGNGTYIIQGLDENTGAYASLIHLDEDQTAPVKLPNNTVYSLFQENNTVWLGTANGLMQIDFGPFPFTNISSGSSSQLKLNKDVVFSIQKDLDRLLIGTSGGGLNILEENKQRIFNEGLRAQDISDNIVRSILVTEDAYWLGTTKGVSILNRQEPGKHEIHKIFNGPEDNTTLSEDNTRQVYQDIHGNIWVCTFGGGINLFTGSVDNEVFSFERIMASPSIENSLPTDNIHCMIQSDSTTYWIGTRDGLARMTLDPAKPSRRTFTTFYHDKEDNSSISNNCIYDIFIDQQGLIWLGTRSGLDLFDPIAGKSTRFGKHNGLENDVIYSILEDSSGTIWVTTNQGISSFDRSSSSFTNYSTKDGIPSNEFCLRAKYYDSSDRIYFGSINGVTSFKPSHLSLGNADKTVQIYSIQREGADTENLLFEKTASNKSGEIKVRYNQFPLKIYFSDFDKRLRKNDVFKYRFPCHNPRWNSINASHLTLTDLSRGDHTLEIQGFYKGEEWSSDPGVFQIIVIPPWWKSIYAYMAYALILLLLTRQIYRTLLTNKLNSKEAEKWRHINEIKTQFYTNITHEFRSPLTVIVGNADLLEKKTKNKKDKASLAAISRNGYQLLSLVNQLLDLAKLEKDKLHLNLIHGNVISYLEQFIQNLKDVAIQKNIDLFFYPETAEVFMDFDRDKIRQVLNNLVDNAIKFTPEAGQIVVHASKLSNDRGSFLRINVQDSGIGIEAKNVDKVFDRFFQVQRDPKENLKGSGIGLSICKEYVELMGGEIFVSSTPNQGSVFTFLIPIRNASRTENATPQPSVRKEEMHAALKSKTEFISEVQPHILVVEDNVDVARLIENILVPEYEVVLAGDGKKGLDIAVHTIPDLIISDIMMPEIDGLSLIRSLKQNIKTSHIPIILLTAKAGIDERIKGISSGANVYLEKPINRSELLGTISNLLSIQEKLRKKFIDQGFQLGDSSANQGLESAFIQDCIAAIHAKISDPTFNSSYLAARMRMSESQLYRKLKAITGKSTAIFIRSIRLRYAFDLLKSKKVNISEAAYDAGFKDPAWFSKTFKEEFGFPPSELIN